MRREISVLELVSVFTRPGGGLCRGKTFDRLDRLATPPRPSFNGLAKRSPLTRLGWHYGTTHDGGLFR